MSTAIRHIKGMNDTLPGAKKSFLDTAVWQHIVDITRQELEASGYQRVWLPVVEDTALFTRGIGEATDILNKEMYSFDHHKSRLTLRPEGTAGAVRSYVEHNFAHERPLQRWWYFGPMFRAERPQEGRYRQFYQFGAELFGTADPTADAEMIAMLWRLCGRLELEDITLRLNSLGDWESRAAYRAALEKYLTGRRDELCESCQGRFSKNPLRVLDCKRPTCRDVVADAPDIAQSLTKASADHFERVRNLLTELEVPFEQDRRLVRGLDYYTGTLFEITTTALGAQDAILGGGRYDDLVEELGGPPTPAIGFSAGVERVALLVATRMKLHGRRGAHLYIVPMQGSEVRSQQLAQSVRELGSWRVEVDVAGGRLKAQMRRADKSGARLAMVVGESELESNRAKLKDLGSAEENDIELTPEAIAAELAKVRVT